MRKTPDCPICKASMVARKGKHGDFFGCQNYPGCRFVTKKRFPAHVKDKDLADYVVPGDFNTRKG